MTATEHQAQRARVLASLQLAPKSNDRQFESAAKAAKERKA